jgi:hypothetical protein
LELAANFHLIKKHKITFLSRFLIKTFQVGKNTGTDVKKSLESYNIKMPLKDNLNFKRVFMLGLVIYLIWILH